MQYKKNQMSVGLMIQRCHRWRQKRKQYLDAARQTADEIERERLLQLAEHYGRIVSDEQGKIDTTRGPNADRAPMPNDDDKDDEDDESFPDFLKQL
ncbi:MAG: hypothetical protein FWC51_04190 [Proteobacteria bacterium]|nr:hypothetical protein [Pseudomonadota bacterium]